LVGLRKKRKEMEKKGKQWMRKVKGEKAEG
jgi:hypothetical protein